jgi:hypothetical protein
MSAFLLVVSALLFISTFGIHMMVISGDKFDRPMYTYNPLLNSIPWISGFILPVIALSIAFEFNWFAIFIINMAIAYILGPFIMRAFLIRFSSGQSLGKDMVYSFTAGFVALLIGLASQ